MLTLGDLRHIEKDKLDQGSCPHPWASVVLVPQRQNEDRQSSSRIHALRYLSFHWLP